MFAYIVERLHLARDISDTIAVPTDVERHNADMVPCNEILAVFSS